MRFLYAFFLAATLSAVSAAQTGQTTPNYTEEQMRARNAPGLFVAGVSAYGPDKKGGSNFVIEVENTGAKAVKALEWDYVPSKVDANYGRDVQMKFRNDDAGLRPGEKKKITGRKHGYASALVSNFRLNAVRITRVEYEDGSVWARPPEEK